jgi:hypothetical protein
MAKRGIIETMDKDLRKELDDKIIARGFGGYEELVEWLREKGYQIRSSTTVQIYGKRLQERTEAVKRAVEYAKAIQESARDDENLLADTLSSLVQERLFSVLVELGDVPVDDAVNFDVLLKLAKVIPALSNSSVQIKKLQMEVKKRALSVSSEVGGIVTESGLSEDVVNLICDKILGIAG